MNPKVRHAMPSALKARPHWSCKFMFEFWLKENSVAELMILCRLVLTINTRRVIAGC